MSEKELNNNSNDNSTKEHPFDRLMFGGKTSTTKRDDIEINRHSEPTSPQLQNNDLSSMIKNLDQIMSSVNQIKPMVKQFSPLIDLFKKKK